MFHVSPGIGVDIIITQVYNLKKISYAYWSDQLDLKILNYGLAAQLIELPRYAGIRIQYFSGFPPLYSPLLITILYYVFIF